MIELALLAFAFVLLLFGVTSGRIDRLLITAPMFFIASGVVLGGTDVFPPEMGLNEDAILLLAELALVLILFTDASRLSISRFRKLYKSPLRLLGIGLPLTILAGALLAALMFPGLGLLEAALIAIILTPTDAGLAQQIVNNERVPVRIRNILNIESGLNDGVVFPLFLVCLVLIESEILYKPFILAVEYALIQIGFGALTGILIGVIGGWVMGRAIAKEWMTPTFQQLGLLALAIISWVLAGEIGGNGFIAAFVGGLVTGYVLKTMSETVTEFAEVEGELLILGVFFTFGLFLPSIFPQLTWQIVLYALLSLTIIRMVPVKISLIGTGFRPETQRFIGWFGPRGLASIVLLLITMQEISSELTIEVVTLTVSATVLISVFAHGITTIPLINWYATTVEKMPPDAPEKEPGEQVPARKGIVFGERG